MALEGRVVVLFARPVEANIGTLGKLAELWLRADRAPDLRLELSACNVIADIVIIAVQTSRPVDSSRIAVSERTADARGVTPHHLSEVAPGIFIVRLSIWILLLLLMPAVGSGTSKLDPVIVIGRSWLLGGEVASGAHMLRHVCALRNVAAGCVSQAFVPDQILSAVEAAPVPVSPHYGTNEFGIILVRSIVIE